MKLLHQEVDIVPGRPGLRPPVWPIPENQPIPGSAVLRLLNTTKQENAYTVRVRCENPFWQEPWCAVIPLPASAENRVPQRDASGAGAESAAPAGKADQRGPHDSWAKVYVPRGATRDILLRFNVPRHPDSRAGRYPFTVEVETQIVGPVPGGRRANRVSRIPGSAIVRPFYQWDIDMQPEQPHVGFRRRSAEFEVTVTNQSNDWLYCDLQVPRPKDYTVEAPTLRLAVPPPEPGEMLAPGPDNAARPGTQRSIPLRGTTKLRIIRGDNTAQSILLSGLRLDAPSVALPLDDGTYPTQGAVVSEESDDTRRLPGDRSLVYCPPIPARLTDFFQRIGSSFRGMLFTLLAAAALLTVGTVLFENAWHNNIEIQPLSSYADPGGTLAIQGQWLPGSIVTIGGEQVTPKFYTTDLTKAKITVPTDLNGKQVKLKAQRFVRFLPFLTALLPSNESQELVQVGKPDTVAPIAEKAFLIAPSGSFHAGDRLELMGGGLGSSGTVYLGGQRVASAWKPDHIGVTIPAGTQPGTLAVSVVDPDGNMLLSNSPVTIVSKNAPTPPQPLKLALTPPLSGGTGGGGAGSAPPPQPRPAQPSRPAPHAATPSAQPAPITPPTPKPQPASKPPAPQPQPQPAGPNVASLLKTGSNAEHHKQYDQAIAAFTQALQADPTNKSARADLVNAYANKANPLMRSRQMAAAIAVYDQGLQAVPNDPTLRHDDANAHYQWGKMLKKAGQPALAQEQWGIVALQYADTSVAKQASQSLAQMSQKSSPHSTAASSSPAPSTSATTPANLPPAPPTDNVSDLNSAGIAASNSGNYAQAVADFRKAFQIDGNNSMVKNNLQTAYNNEAISDINSHKFPDAINVYTQALSDFPDEPTLRANAAVTYNNYGVTLYNSGQAAQARAEWNIVVSQFSETQAAQSAKQYLNQTK